MADLDDEMFKRLVLANQYEILAHLDRDSRESYARGARMLREWWPLELLTEIEVSSSYRNDPLSMEDVRFVGNILDLFEKLQDAEDKGMKSRQGLENLAFPGFSGNEETTLLSYYRYTRGIPMFESLRLANPNDLNSHFPMTEAYARMLSKWEEFGKPPVLSEEQFHAITYEWIHPENRRDFASNDT